MLECPPPLLAPPPPTAPREPPPEETPPPLPGLWEPPLEPPLQPPERPLLDAPGLPPPVRTPLSERDDEPISEPAREPLSERDEPLDAERGAADGPEEVSLERAPARREPTRSLAPRSRVSQSPDRTTPGAFAGVRSEPGRVLSTPAAAGTG